MRKESIIAAFFIVLLATTASHATVFNVNRTIGTGSVVGTVTTDSTLGVLASVNVTAWSLTIDEGDAEGSFLLTDANSDLLVIGDGLTATLSQLLFDFSDTDDLALWQNPTTGSGINFWCVENTANCTGQGPNVETVHREGPFFSGQVASRTGDVVIGTAVPEPATLALLGLGLAGLGFSRRKQ